MACGNSGTATLTDCAVSGNSANDGGGGLYNHGGTLTLINCTVSGNSANDGGGGLSTRNGTLALTNCTVSANSGYIVRRPERQRRPDHVEQHDRRRRNGAAARTPLVDISGANDLIGGSPLLAPAG